MRNLSISIFLTAAMLLATGAASAESAKTLGQGQSVLTVQPKNGEVNPASLVPGDLRVKVDGKLATITSVTALRGPASPIELVILIDSSARTSLGGQLGELTHFIQETPSDTKIALAYMQNGSAVLATPLTADPAQAERGLHLPVGSLGSSASPYFCLSDLAKHWPSQDPKARRVVLMITDGVDNYNPRFDPEDPYLHAAIDDALRAGLVVNSIYWTSRGSMDNTSAGSFAGQNLLQIVSESTGGISYWQGNGNPVNFAPYLTELRHRLRNQYLLTFTAPLNGKPSIKAVIASLDLKVTGSLAKVEAPRQVLVRPAMASAK